MPEHPEANSAQQKACAINHQYKDTTKMRSLGTIRFGMSLHNHWY